MKILSVRKGFLADHSSTSYEFLAIDKPLDAKARAAVAGLSSRAAPTSRRVEFVYHADGYDIPGGWLDLMLAHYDVMFSESYDWWTLAVAFDTDDDERVARLERYVFLGDDDLGVSVDRRKRRVVVSIGCRVSTGAQYGMWGESHYGDDDEDEEELGDGPLIVTGDPLLDLLARVRSCLMQGQFQPLYAVWEAYGYDDEDADPGDAPPRPRSTKQARAVAEELAEILESTY